MATLARGEPFGQLWDEMSRLHNEMDRLFDHWGFGYQPRQPLAVTYPPINVWEDENHVYAAAELPGLKLQDLEIYVTGGNQLAIKGTREPALSNKGVWHRQERPFGSFQRLITLPFSVDPDKVEASFEHGILTITMAKSEAAKPRRITVKAE